MQFYIFSSHWDKRTLHHEVMNGFLSKYVPYCFIFFFYWFCYPYSDYEILSEFTLALFEDSGWYKANYTALYNLKQHPLHWGKGKLYISKA